METKETSPQICIIPQPAHSEGLDGFFTLDHETPLALRNVDEDTADYIRGFLNTRLGIDPPPCRDAEGGGTNRIVFTLDENEAPRGEGAYRLTVENGCIRACAGFRTGLVYALQSLYQLIALYNGSGGGGRQKKTVPHIRITDYPRFEWRGYMLDVSRHFFSVDHIEKQLDLMALYKLNKFHWHFTDDHGWRMETETYPRLMDIGAWRPDRSGAPWKQCRPPQKGEPAVYGGYYTRGEMRHVVHYAARRGIDVIPEIEIPGHCSEVLAAYPEFACDDFPYTVQTGRYWPPKAILCGGNDGVMRFLFDILEEAAGIFPSPYIHIGGDEAHKGNWKKCPKCQRRIKERKLKNEEALQGWMIREAERHLAALGKKSIGWDEILEGGVSKNAVIMYWRDWKGEGRIAEAARRGHDIIACPASHCYLDYSECKDESGREGTGRYLSLKKAYAFEPLPRGLEGNAAQHILGGQGNLWTEYVYTPACAEYRLLPRLLALSEALWTPPDARSWEGFAGKLPLHRECLSSLGYQFHRLSL
ncbi:MAG: beta-N-acetylhexosaminidase [Treponema sp.]|jgi:hexosaminidase|nr:beta-N-acetylhexosaminidase [Treponema sp.]